MEQAMRALVVMLALVSACTGIPSTVYAQPGGIEIAWKDCISQPAAAANVSYACDGSLEGVPFKLVVSFVSPANLGQFVGIQVVIDMRTSAASLPDWWRLGVGECRDSYLTFPASLSGIGTGTTGTCRNPWAGTRTGGGYAWYSENRGDAPPPHASTSPGRALLKLAFARETETSLEFGQRYVAGVIGLDPGPLDPEAVAVPNTVLLDRRERHALPLDSAGPPLCTGCSIDACIVVNQVELYQTAGQVPPQQDIYYLRTAGIQQFVTWQGGDIGGNGCPLEVPTRRTTWGGIKAIYR